MNSYNRHWTSSVLSIMQSIHAWCYPCLYHMEISASFQVVLSVSALSLISTVILHHIIVGVLWCFSRRLVWYLRSNPWNSHLRISVLVPSDDWGADSVVTFLSLSSKTISPVCAGSLRLSSSISPTSTGAFEDWGADSVAPILPKPLSPVWAGVSSSLEAIRLIGANVIETAVNRNVTIQCQQSTERKMK